MIEFQNVLVLIGLMGAGKTSIGSKLGAYLNIEFKDADAEIVKAAGCTIQEIFENRGETVFRDLEERVIKRLLPNGPMILATGGGAYMNPRLRKIIKKYGFTIWLNASLEVLINRTSGRAGRPLLEGRDSRKILSDLMGERYPIYSEADLIIDTDTQSIQDTLRSIILAIQKPPLNFNGGTVHD